MVGDNLQSDIEGAVRAGWDSILVKTGVETKDSLIATVNADNVY